MARSLLSFSTFMRIVKPYMPGVFCSNSVCVYSVQFVVQALTVALLNNTQQSLCYNGIMVSYNGRFAQQYETFYYL